MIYFQIMNISKDLLELLLPHFIVNHFSFLKSTSDEEKLHLYFEEINDKGSFTNQSVESKGYYKEIIVEDFPLRGKLVYFHIKSRRLRDIETKEELQRDWNYIAKGTRMTEEFVIFLKEINRY
jgi:hypothetical protein